MGDGKILGVTMRAEADPGSVGTPLARASREVAEILYACLEGKALGTEEATRLMRTSGADFQALIAVASLVRSRHKGNKVSFSKKVFIPLTNLCRDYCGYCAFRKEPSHPEAKTLNPAEVVELARRGEKAGCKEALFLLGDRPEVRYPEARDSLGRLGYRNTMEYLRDMCELVAKKTGLLPHSNPGLMSYRELTELKEFNVSMGLMLESISERLGRAGGPHEYALSKRPPARLATLEAAGRAKVPFTTGILIGIGETLEERVDSLAAILKVHQQHGHIQEVIIQNFRSKPGTPMAGYLEPTVEDMMKTIAVARLMFRGEINIQAPPNLTPTEYGEFLRAGINDWGGVSPVTMDYVNPEAPWPKLTELREVSGSFGFELKERLAVYPEYLTSRRGFLSELMAGKARVYVDEEGYVKS